jgi:glutathione S-transferase
MMRLKIYPGNFGEPSASPFCVKAMCLMEMAGLEWTPEFSNDPRKAPKAKFPVLRDGKTLIADSDQIRSHLETTYGTNFDEGLTDAQRAASRAVIRMMEEHLYFAIICDRWLNDANWALIRRAYFGHIPKMLNGFVTGQIRKQAVAQVNGHGMGRHSPDERFERAGKDVEAVVDLLGDKAFLFGDTATAADATVVPMLRAAAGTPVKTSLSEMINGKVSLMAYLDRGRDAIYPGSLAA